MKVLLRCEYYPHSPPQTGLNVSKQTHENHAICEILVTFTMTAGIVEDAGDGD